MVAVAPVVWITDGALLSSMVVTLEKPRPPSVVCGDSTAAAKANLPPKSFTTRKPYWRAQVKPTLYCESITIGGTSWRLTIPFLFSVARDHICPAVSDKPLSQATCANACRVRQV